MTALAWLIPCALVLGGLGLVAFLWSLRSGQFDDLEGAGWRGIEDHAGPDVSGPERQQAAPASKQDDALKAD
ncbi:cbb3-type cytochrome oxidase assembly protein CcoS [Hyphomicrobium sulfonivorans]|uniref:cbb3-type cytochrome oxidase assembly protein CcoS n=1 Tax=Hyphomicrobium sulfonivorans TaxID=121290 RepID=UPI0015706BB9|nr:cbb3-type cytochrome oxidase assembly protein CcoS [Hyphomicrobium sulfonivorans]MBI1649232.1 cbb3-type cytochrome oxidase assembly protein CcoS [Hyphomicrobium sulfonivorans]NSL70237.1 cbb3-type cytochrome oxidase assembly protein CcoS [Hyphomicrobium sulfonivorans]